MVAILYKCLLFSFLCLGGLFKDKSTTAPAPTNTIGRYHPFYISVTEINHNSKDKTLEISCKLFADDLEQTLERNYKTQLDITEAKYKPMVDKLINDYISKHLGLAVDGKVAKLQYLGFEKEKESAYCYFQAENVPSVRKLEINNSLLYDFNDTEINIMHVMVNGKRQSTKLDYPQKMASFSF